MATTYSVESIGRNSAVFIVTWGPLANDETGDVFAAPSLTDATIHSYGVFSGASLSLEGSNDTDASTTEWETLSEPSDTLYSGIIASGIAQILESPYKYRPVVSGGDGSTAITVKLKVVGNSGLSLTPETIKVL
jgi:hypothetical protein